jgi:DNA-binding phage protein
MKINCDAFKKLRESKLLGVYNLAKQADVSPSIVKSLEEGGRPRLESIRKVIVALGLTVEEAYQKKLIED